MSKQVIDIEIKGDGSAMTPIRQKLEDRSPVEVDPHGVLKKQLEALQRRDEALEAKRQAARDYSERVMNIGEEHRKTQEKKLADLIEAGELSQKQAAERRAILLADTIETAKAEYQKAKELAEKRESDYLAGIEEMGKKLQHDIAEAESRRADFMAKRQLEGSETYMKAKKIAAKKQIDVERSLDELQASIERDLALAIDRRDESIAAVREKAAKEAEKGKIIRGKTAATLDAQIAEANKRMAAAEERRAKMLEETRQKAAADVELARKRSAAKK